MGVYTVRLGDATRPDLRAGKTEEDSLLKY